MNHSYPQIYIIKELVQPKKSLNRDFYIFYIIKEFIQPKMSLNREFLIWKERGRVVREREGWVIGSAGSHV